MDEPASFGRLLRTYRRARDLTQDELARRAGCALTTIQKIEADERRPSRELAMRFAKVLDVPTADASAFLRLARGLLPDAVPHLQPLVPPFSPQEVGAEDLSGREVRGYVLRERLGMGGFGAVYRAVQSSIQREVAVKIILPRYANHADFVRRFEAEAQFVARLEHPYIVPLYDYWREPGSACLVMRYMRGGSLAAALRDGPLTPSDALQVLEQVGSALATAHRAGVVHRDLKPANVLRDAEGNTFLADFGIAKDLGATDRDGATQAGAIVGSPDYLSPEQITDEPITPRTDIYSLGVMLYELLTAAKPFGAQAPAELLRLHLNAPLPQLQERRPELPEALNAIIQRSTAKNPAERYPDTASLVSAFRAALGATATGEAEMGHALATVGIQRQTVVLDLLEIQNPYKGLRAFAEADSADFFGREALVARLLERLAEAQEDTSQRSSADENQQLTTARFLAVVGPSGSGKSSVVRAGLIPALRQGGLPGSERWFIADSIPGAQPLEELELALLKVAIRTPSGLAEQLRRDARGLLRASRLILPDDGSELVLVIDQFEELFTLVDDEADRQHFLDSLVAAATDPRSRVRVIITLRADFYDRPLRYPNLGELMRERTEVVLPLGPDELEQAIVAPARRAGVRVEPELVADVVRDVGAEPGALPLLQYALTELFERREGRMLTRAAYRASGGVRGALARRAEGLYQALDPATQPVAREIFLRLVALGEGAEDTRRRVLRSELAALAADESQTTRTQTNSSLVLSILHPASVVDEILDRYGRARLLTFDHNATTRAPTVEVAHEALLREWARLREWLDASRAAVRTLRQLAAAAEEWAQHDRDAGYLASGARLAQFAALAERGDIALNVAERAYLEASLAEREQQQQTERERQRREVEHLRALADARQRYADEQSRAATQLRWRAILLAGVLVVALLAAAVAGVFAQNNATLATQNAASARTAQAAGDQAVAGRATAVAEAQLRATQQALAEANFTIAQRQRLALEANNVLDHSRNPELAALLALRSLHMAYSPEADAALLRAIGDGFPRQVFRGHTDRILSAAFAPDSRTVLTASRDGTARLWDVASGHELRQLTHDGASWVNTGVFSPDGKAILTGGDDGTARLWDAQTGQELRRFSGHNGRVTSVAVSPDGKYVLTGGGDKSARLWDAATGQQLRQFAGHTDGLLSVAFSPDGRFALTSGNDKTARLWDVATGQPVRTFTGHADAVAHAAFSPDGRWVLTASADKTARLWDAQTGQELRRFSDTDYVYGAVFLPDGNTILTGGGNNLVQLWDAQTGNILRQFVGHTDVVFAVAVSPDGGSALTVSDDLTARLWDLRSIPGVRILAGHTDQITLAVFSPDGKEALTGSYDKTARLWDTATGRQVGIFTAPTKIEGVALSPDGKLAVAGSTDGTARLWDVATGKLLHVFTGHGEHITGLAFSPDGKYILAGSYDKTAWLWDVATGQHVRTFSGHTNWVFGVAFSPDGQQVITGGFDRTTRIWDAATGQQLRKLDNTDEGIFSPDGRYLLTASGKIGRLLDAQTGHELHQFVGHADNIIGLAFSPDGHYVLTSSFDRTVRLWDASTGRQLRQLAGHTDGVPGLAVSPDGRQILSASWDGTARLWRTNLQDVIQLACTQLARDLTDDERKLYNIPSDSPTCQET